MLLQFIVSINIQYLVSFGLYKSSLVPGVKTANSDYFALMVIVLNVMFGNLLHDHQSWHQ